MREILKFAAEKQNAGNHEDSNKEDESDDEFEQEENVAGTNFESLTFSLISAKAHQIIY